MIYRASKLLSFDKENLIAALANQGLDLTLTTDIDWCGHSAAFDRYAFIETPFPIDANLIALETGIELTPLNDNQFLQITVIPPSEELAEVSSIKKMAINRTRDSLESSPITYDAKLLDADAEAIKNINGKLQELQAKETLNLPIDANSLFWRDADNVIHTWTDATAYKAWLQGLVIAIAERTSSLYQIAWQKKAEIDALTTIEELLAYDVEAGW